MDLLKHVPDFSAADAVAWVRTRYGLESVARPLLSERDQNFHLRAANGREFVLKIANATEDERFLEAQSALLERVAAQGIDFCPQIVLDRQGASGSVITSATGQRHPVRLLTYLPGTLLAHARRRSDALLFDLGHKLGRLDRALVDFDHPATHRDFHWDLARGPDIVDRYRPLVTDGAQGALIDRLLADFRRHAAPLLPHLRQSVIHGDANDHNVLIGSGGEDLYAKNQRVTGLIDFGDMVFSQTVGNLAVAAAYALLDRPDPLAAAAAIARGYHAAHPLTDDELAALFGLINLRLCVSICLAAVQQAARPDDEYLAVSQAPIRRTLPVLADVPYSLATARLRHACGFDPLPASARVVNWLARQPVAPVLGQDLNRGNTLTLDLSVGSPLLHGDPAHNMAPSLSARIDAALADHGATVGIGRYNEPRLIYTEAAFAGGTGPLAERRTIHLGLDLFAPAGSPVHAPLDGVVQAAGYFPDPQDYGGALLLAHRTGDGDPFFTLYGHLSRESAAALRPGQVVVAGEEIGRLGSAAENGGWPPHLHLQLVIDPLGYGAGFPGVAPAGQRALWRAFSPDPSATSGVPAACEPAVRDTFEQTLAARRTHLGRNLGLAYRQPLKIERGWRQYLWDHQGRRYLDAYNNVPHVGHCHPHVVAAGQRQMGVLNTNTRYLNDLQNRYAERLGATLPDPLHVCYFVNSASEANELALRLVRAATGRREMIVLEGAYHGHTTGLIDISPYKHAGPGGGGAPPWVHTAPLADVYRGPYKADDPQAGVKYAGAVQAVIERMAVDGKAPGAFIAESCPSVGGQIIFPPGYLAGVYAHVRAAGGLAIADEVQTGLGRTGSHFYAFEAQGVVPDIVVLGKPIGNGHPIAAVVTTAEIAAAFDNGMEFFSTFGGNTVSCAVGLAVLEVLEAEGLQAHARRVGRRLLDGLRPLVDRYPIVGDVRGAGLFLGLELVRDRQTLSPAAFEASFVVNRLCDGGILAGTDGPWHNVVKIRPPMPFDEGNAELLIAALETILQADFAP